MRSLLTCEKCGLGIQPTLRYRGLWVYPVLNVRFLARPTGRPTAELGREPSLHQTYIGASDLMRVSACAAQVAVAGLIRNTVPLPTPIALGDHLDTFAPSRLGAYGRHSPNPDGCQSPGRQRRLMGRVPDFDVAQEVLNEPCVHALVRQRVDCGLAQHVWGLTRSGCGEREGRRHQGGPRLEPKLPRPPSFGSFGTLA